MKKRGVIFVISGPSGSGKTTLSNGLLKDRSLRTTLVKSISMTTRRKRTGEEQARDYFFVSEKEFLRRLKDKSILEWTKYLGYYYGTPKEFVDEHLARGHSLILCLDFRGAKRIKKLYPKDAITIFINLSSFDSLAERIRKRSRDTKEKEVEKRIRRAKREIQERRHYDYEVVNDDFDRALLALKNIVKKARKRESVRG